MQVIQHAILPLQFDVKPLQAAISQLASSWVPHFNTNYYSGAWTSLALRAPGGRNDSSVPDNLNFESYADTPLMALLPEVQPILQAFPVAWMSVRLLNLAAGAEIREHRDAELSMEQGEMRLHIPVQTNEQVSFVLNGQRLAMKQGSCWYINANLPHSVKNEGDTDRIHLVMDGRVNDWLKGQIDHAEKAYAEMTPPDVQLRIIEELRLQNTPAAHALAEQLQSELFQRPS